MEKKLDFGDLSVCKVTHFFKGSVSFFPFFDYSPDKKGCPLQHKRESACRTTCRNLNDNVSPFRFPCVVMAKSSCRALQVHFQNWYLQTHKTCVWKPFLFHYKVLEDTNKTIKTKRGLLSVWHWVSLSIWIIEQEKVCQILTHLPLIVFFFILTSRLTRDQCGCPWHS